MIKFIITNVFMLTGFFAIAQTTPTTLTINKKIQPGLVLQLPNNTEVAEGTILQKLKETGYSPETMGQLFWKKNKVDGFYVFNGVTLPALNNQKLDMYFKVDQKSKSQKEESTIYLLVSKGYDNFISAESDTITFAAATAFLNGFVNGTANFRLNLDIEEQEKVIQNAEKKLLSLKEDNKAISKKIESLQADQRNKTNDEAMQEKEILNQKVKLQELKVRFALK